MISELKANYPQDLILLLKPVTRDAHSGDYRQYLEGFYSKENLFPITKYILENLYDIINKQEMKERDYNWGHDIIFQLKRALVTGKHYSIAEGIFKEHTHNYIQWALKLENPEIDLDEYRIFYIIIETIAQYESKGDLEEPLLQLWKRIPKEKLDDVLIFPISSCLLFDEEEIHKYLYHEGKSHTIDYHLPSDYDEMALYLNVIKLLSKKVIDQNLIEHILVCLKLIYDNVTYSSPEEHRNLFLHFEDLKRVVSKNDIPDELFNIFRFFMEAYAINSVEPYEDIKLTKAETNKFNKNFNIFFKWCISTENYIPLKNIWYDVCHMAEKNFLVTQNAHRLFLASNPTVAMQLIDKSIISDFAIEPLFENQDYKLIVELFQKGYLSDYYYFEIAYSFSELKNHEAAKRIYSSIVESGKESNAVCNNLGVIYSNDNNNEEALKWFKRAVELDPNDQIAKKNVLSTERELEEEKEKPKKLTESYFRDTNRYHNKLLFAIYKLKTQSMSIEQLAEATKQKVSYVEKNISELIHLGILSNQTGKLIIDPVIEKLVADYVDSKLERQIIQVDQTNMSRPIFYHESEISLYQVLLELFPQHFVFPNISLKTIVDVEKIRDMISNEQMNYLFMAHVDFAIISTSSYMPVLAIEKDSVYHDNNSTIKKDEIKNNIFRLSGIPLIRVRYNKAMAADKLKQEIRNATKELIIALQKDTSKDHRLFSEVDIRNFGVSIQSMIDLDKLWSIWSKIVGEGISKKSKIIDLHESNELHVSISYEFETMINFSKEQILTKIKEEIPEVSDIVISYY
ncbi:DciA family protein [Paenibacillus massiliensis]|uniref:DciA family protein n=1 Tax=Paenibacillus massiliensis TaxID=225917 RepID=UPI000471D87B|nr:DciA family protein [Paenibacillus massiliensis]